MRWLVRRLRSSIVAYVRPQSTERPTRRHRSSKARSSSDVNWWQSAMKLGRLTGTSSLPGFSGGTKAGSKGRDGSHVTPKTFCTRRSVGSPLSSQPMG